MSQHNSRKSRLNNYDLSESHQSRLNAIHFKGQLSEVKRTIVHAFMTFYAVEKSHLNE